MEISEEERCLILQHRRKVDDELKPKAAHLLDVSARYLSWLIENGAGSTYSTFCNDFGYEPVDGEDRSVLYEKVLNVISFAKDLSRQ